MLSLYIPGLVETDQLENIARSLKQVDRSIPFTILAFFPEYRMKKFARPAVWEMIEAYNRVKATGLENIRLGNVGVFAPTKVDQDYLMSCVGKGVY